ncbi:MAG: hypothetical protein GC179_23200 [Anaerolineaceae bacterium]|nr:hypothetical protein [Anaerolineaceae bacterium]
MFGRLLALIGVVMIGFGIFGIVRASQSFMGTTFGSTMQLATDAKAREAQLCKPGEKLEESKGASQYTPGQGYASSVTMYCVNSEGQKRDVTEEFANGLVGQVGGLFDNVLSQIGSFVIYPTLIVVGVVLAIIGLLIGRRRSRADSFGVVGGAPTVYTTTYTSPKSGDSIDLNQIIQQARDMKASSSADLSTRLKQLEDAKNAGLISQTEYDRARQNILDTLK